MHRGRRPLPKTVKYDVQFSKGKFKIVLKCGLMH
jgi:hypothetical protein